MQAEACIRIPIIMMMMMMIIIIIIIIIIINCTAAVYVAENIPSRNINLS